MRLFLESLLLVFLCLSAEAVSIDQDGHVDFGLPTDRTNPMGLAIGTAQDLFNYFLQITLDSIKFPYVTIWEIASVLGGGGLQNRLVALAEVFARNAWGGATFHFQFLKGLTIIFYNLARDSVKLLASPYASSSISRPQLAHIKQSSEK